MQIAYLFGFQRFRGLNDFLKSSSVLSTIKLCYPISVISMNAHRIETALTENGKLSLQNLPFKRGDEVEIIIIQKSSSQTSSNLHPLKGTVIRYDDPFEPVVSPEDWEALQ